MLKRYRILIPICAVISALVLSSVVTADDGFIITARQTEPIVAYLVQPEQLKPAPVALSHTETIILDINDIDLGDVTLAQPGGADVTVSEGWIFGSADYKTALINIAMATVGVKKYEVGWRA